MLPTTPWLTLNGSFYYFNLLDGARFSFPNLKRGPREMCSHKSDKTREIAGYARRYRDWLEASAHYRCPGTKQYEIALVPSNYKKSLYRNRVDGCVAELRAGIAAIWPHCCAIMNPRAAGSLIKRALRLSSRDETPLWAATIVMKREPFRLRFQRMN